MKIANAHHSSNVHGAETNLKKLKGSPKIQEGVHSNTFKIEFVISKVKKYIVVRTKQLLLLMDI